MFDLVYGNLLPDPEFGTWSSRGVHTTGAHLYSFLKYNPNIRGDIRILWNSNDILYIEPEWKTFLEKIFPVTFVDIKDNNIIDEYYNPLCFTDTLINAPITDTRTINRIAVVVHLYYYEFWSDIYNLTKNIPPTIEHDIHVYIPDDNLASTGRLPASKIVENINKLNKSNIFTSIIPNRGRDIGSFLQFINDNKWRNYDAICKVHTKLTKSISPQWRQELLEGVLGASTIKNCIKALESSNMVGCNKHLIASNNKRFKLSKQNRSFISSLCTQHGLDPVTAMSQWAFYAGTMFWITPNVLHAIQKSYTPYMTTSAGEFTYDIFPKEPAPNNNTLIHGWERFFGIISNTDTTITGISTPEPLKNVSSPVLKTVTTNKPLEPIKPPSRSSTVTVDSPLLQQFLDSLPYEFEHDTYCELYPDLPTGRQQAIKHLRRSGLTEKRIYNRQQLTDINMQLEGQVNRENKTLDLLQPQSHERLINILIRTNNRPELFKKCIDSILEQQYTNYRVYVCVQTDSDNEYANSISSNKITIIKGRKTSNKPYFFNDFSNQLLQYVTDGWVMFLDDDDKLSHSNALLAVNDVIDEDNIVFWKYRRPDALILPDISGKLIRASITSCGYCFHNKYIQDNKWAVKRQGDFDFISKLYNKIPKKIAIDYTLTQYQRSDRIASFGKAIDIKPITTSSDHPLSIPNCQLYTSTGLKHLEDRFKQIYNLASYTDKNKPCIFFGFYLPEDFDAIRNHTGDRYIMFGGTDCDFTYKHVHNAVRTIMRTGFKKCFSISSDIKQRLDTHNVPNTLIGDFSLVDATLFKPCTSPGDSIFIYNGLNGAKRGEVYGESIYTQVTKKLPNYNYIYSNELHTSYDKMPGIYKKCFIGLRLTPNDGNANMVQELQAMNIPVVHNQSTYGLNWKTVDCIINHIKDHS
jgi:hypothetical protein